MLEKSLSAAFIGLFAIGLLWVFQATADSTDLTRRVLYRRAQQSESVHSLEVTSAATYSNSSARLTQNLPTETDDAQAGFCFQLQDLVRFVAPRTEAQKILPSRICRTESPDFLIVLPGTPPPVLI